MTRPTVRAFFDEATFTVSYLVSDPETREAAVIDPVLDFDQKSGRTSTGSVEALLAAARSDGLDIRYVLETHAHADHLSGAPLIHAATGAPIVIGAHIADVQKVFKPIFNLQDMPTDGRPFHRLVADGERLKLGALEIAVMHTPGHTPACVTYVVGDAAFVGDTLFMPDFGTARADFPGGDARVLFRSIRRILDLPPQTRIFVGHDYKAPGREVFAWETTVALQRAGNVHVHDGVSEDAYAALREARDKTLAMPALILPSIQVNIRAGHLPDPEDNGVRYLKLPVDAL
jgi:glyoxylase-like metal-dependent hydrolase (beta-lactamase superfamily II)